MKNIIILFSISLISLTSCDPNMKTDLCNDTDESIILKVQLDIPYIKQTRNDLPIIDFLLLNKYDSTIIAIKIDSLKYSGDFSIRPHTCYQIDGGINPVPSMYYSRMEIQSKSDTIVIIGRENINNSFKEYDNYRFRLTIK